MEKSSTKRPSNHTRKKNSCPLPKTKLPFPSQSAVIWSNSVFVSDECSSVGSNVGFESHMRGNKRSEFIALPVTVEELKLREELAMEIEKELERELMEGIIALVRRLSDLKAKQIVKGLENLSPGYGHQCDGLLSDIPDLEAHFRSRKGNAKDVERSAKKWMQENAGRQKSSNYAGVQISQCSDAESSTANTSNRRQKWQRGVD